MKHYYRKFIDNFIYNKFQILILMSLVFLSLYYTSSLNSEEWSYWFFNKILKESWRFTSFDRSSLYVLYLSLFSWLNLRNSRKCRDASRQRRSSWPSESKSPQSTASWETSRRSVEYREWMFRTGIFTVSRVGMRRKPDLPKVINSGDSPTFRKSSRRRSKLPVRKERA